MDRIEKTVFLSYRRTSAAWALAIFQCLTSRGYDVFFDFTGLAAGDFERVILENIRARAHFIVLLTPSALERCGQPGDWLRREIETAIETKRNIVPLLLDSFDFNAAGVSSQLTGRMAVLGKYNGLRVPVDYFDEAMTRLCTKYLNVRLDTVLHPVSSVAQQVARDQQTAAEAEPPVQEDELAGRAQSKRAVEQPKRTVEKPKRTVEKPKRAVDRTDLKDKIRFYTEAIRKRPEDAIAFHNRGVARDALGDGAGARMDYDNAIRLRNEFERTQTLRPVRRNDPPEPAKRRRVLRAWLRARAYRRSQRST